MKKYFVKTPWWLKKIYPSYVWDIKTDEKVLYLTFDDGPHPIATPFVLDTLNQYNAKATFFCLGKNVEANDAIYKRIIQEGHMAGNHTYNHLNGWKTENETYLADVSNAAKKIDSSLFRPPYGRIKTSQAKQLAGAMGVKKAKVIMWDVLSGDFDVTILPEQCYKNVTRSSRPGSIIVFHDSEKAFPVLKKILSEILQFFSDNDYGFRVMPEPNH